jgi:hypothetical protein
MDSENETSIYRTFLIIITNLNFFLMEEELKLSIKPDVL